MAKTLQERMFEQVRSKTLFKQANAYGFEYLDELPDRHVYPTGEALHNLTTFDTEMPEETGDPHAVLDLLHEYGAPATVTQMGGRYFGFVNGGVIPAGLAAKNLAVYWDQNCGLQMISPLASKLESVVQRWLIDLFGLPKQTVVGFVSGTSMANFCGLAAARYRILQKQGWDITEKGLFGAPPIRVIAGKEAHSTILKAISLTGLGKSNIEWVDTDAQGRILADQIPPLDTRSILILQAGNVNSGSFDPFSRICEQARNAGAWIHIDGAFGLWAGATKQLNQLTAGFEFAHSWAVDAHKTLNTPYDSGLILCADEEALTASLHMAGGYIIRSEGRDGMYYTPEMSRRARIIELWATLKYLGKAGINELIAGLHERALQFAAELANLEGFEVLNEVVFNQVVVACESDALTDLVITKIQELRECWVGGSIWKDRKVIRISICSWATTPEDVTRSVESFRRAHALALEQIR